MSHSWCVSLQEEEPGSLPLSLTVSDYLTPSWSLSPSSSPLSHSEASDSDREEDEEEEEDDDDDDDDEEDLEDLRGRMMRRRKKRKTSATVKKKAQPHPLSFTCPAPSSPPSFQQPLAPPTTNINNNININIGASGTLSRRQHCPYCGRHFRSLARHLEKHHEQQPEVRAAMELSHPPNQDASSHPFSSPPQPSAVLGTTSLFSRERDALSSPPKSAGVSFSLSLSPPPASSSSKKSSAMNVTPRKGTRKSPGVSPNPPARRGRPPKKQKELQLKKQEEAERAKEEAPGKQEENEDEEDFDASTEQKNGEMAR